MTRYSVGDDVRRLTSEPSESRHLDPYNPEKMRELQARRDVLKTTDMALIVSPGQNEIENLKKHALDIVPHRQRML